MSNDLPIEDWLMDDDSNVGYALSEASLAEAWDRPEEVAAWAYLQIYSTPRYPLLGWKNDPRTVP